ncbi:hypothetical protein KAU32_04995, partial [bacterium]|nr:hypothetical protein [bacterium]
YFRDDRDEQNIKIMTEKNRCKDFLRVIAPIENCEVILKDISYDGKVAFVIVDEELNNFLYIVNLANDVLYTFDLGKESFDRHIEFSNKGDKIFYYLHHGDGLYILTLETGEKHYIPDSKGLSPSYSDWNKDDTKIVFGFYYSRNEIIIYDLEKKEMQVVFQGRRLKGNYRPLSTTIRNPLFVSDSEIIFFDKDNSSIWKLNYKTGKISLFYNGKKTRSCLFTYSDTELIGITDITPDGNYIICARWRATHLGREAINLLMIDLKTKRKYSLYTYAAGLSYFAVR